MKLSPKKRIAIYSMAGTAALSGGVGTALAAMSGGAGAQAADTPAATAPAGPARGDRDGARIDHLAVVAGALGMDAAALRTELAAGKSIAQVATTKGVDVQKVIDALVAAKTKAIDEAVAAGTLTQADADTRKAGLAERAKAEVELVGLHRGGHGGGGRGHGRRGGGMGAHVDVAAVVAPVLGVDAAAVTAELQAGKSLAQLATGKGVDVQKVIDAIVAAETKAIDEATASAKASLVERTTQRVNRTGLGKPGRGGPSTGSTPSSTTTTP